MNINSQDIQDFYNSVDNPFDIPVTENGLWEYPNQEVIVPTNGSITMKGVDYPVIGKSLETGEEKIMMPDKEYFFHNTENVHEIPQFQKGGLIYYPEIDKEIPQEAKNNFLNALNFENEYISTPKFKERVEKAGGNFKESYKNLKENLRNLKFKTDNKNTSEHYPAFYNLFRNSIDVNPKYSDNYRKRILTHEIGHLFDDDESMNFINDRNFLVPTDNPALRKKIENGDNYLDGFTGHEQNYNEMIADIHSARQELYDYGKKNHPKNVYDGRYSNFTNDAYNDLLKISQKDPDSSARYLLDKVGSYDLEKLRKNIKSKKPVDKKALDKAEKEFKETQKKYIFDLMNKVVNNDNTFKEDEDLFYAQKGGSIDNENVKNFYNDMLNAPWYKERLNENGYMDSDNVISKRLKNINRIDFSVNNSVNTGYSQYKNLPSFLSNPNVTLNTNESDYLNTPYNDSISHEYGHGETKGYDLSAFEKSLIEDSYIGNDNDKQVNYLKSPYETKSDINAIRYHLYNMGKYNPKTGEYDTDSKLFEPSLLNNDLENTIIKRMKDAYGNDNLKKLMNTVADTNSKDKGYNA